MAHILKRYIVRKYVMAGSADEALQREGMHIADEVFLDDKWIEKNEQHSSPKADLFGFVVSTESDSGFLQSPVAGDEKRV